MRPAPLVRRALAAALLLLAPALRPAAAQAPVVVARVGGELAGRIGQYVDVPVTVDMSGSLGRMLGSYRADLIFDRTVLYYQQTRPGSFAEPLVNTDSAYSAGKLRFTAVLPAGAGGVVTLFVVRFYVLTDTTASPITISFDEMSAAGTFEDLLPYLSVINGTFCKSLGTWGDPDGDGTANSRDALLALSRVVGLVGDTIIDTLSTVPVLVTDTMLLSLADVDADGGVSSRDALIILSYAVGLPVPGFRIGLPAAGACATGSATTLVIVPDSLELQSGQQAFIVLQARDASGRDVPTGTVVWRSSNTAVAAFLDDYYGPRIEARDPGVATLTAELGPGVKTTLEVVVIARRLNWYVDVQRALNAPTQTGSQAFPFAFIGDAMEEATDGDTVHVASGQYDERVSAYVSVVLLGDSLSRPIVDQRGSQYYYPYYPTISAGSAAAKMEIAHFVVRGSGIYIEGHDNTVRDVRIEMLGGLGTALEIYSQPFVAPPAPPAAASALVQRDLGFVLVENVVVDGYGTNGIEIDQADTAIVRNNTVLRDSTSSTPYCFGCAIGVYSVNASEVRDNVIVNASCDGIQVEHESGRAIVSGNRVTRAARKGVHASAPIILLDHNVLRDLGTDVNYAAQSRGIHIVDLYNVDVDSVTSVGDSIVNSDYLGFQVDSARVGVIDSLTVDGTGQDSSYSGDGLQVNRGRFTVSHSIVRNAGTEGRGSGLVVASLSDTAVVTGNTIDLSGKDGMEINSGSLVRVDSNVVTNSGMSGLVFYTGSGGRATRNRFQNNGWYGVAIDASAIPTFPSVASNTIQGNVLGGAANFSSLYATMDADSNYWGDALGPRCDSAVTGVACNPASLGDSVVTAGVTFVPFLTGAPATPAPPVLSAAVTRAWPATAAVQVAPSSAARLPSAGSARQLGRQATAIASPPPSTVRVRAQRRPFPPALRRGQEPRPPRQPTPPGSQ